MNWRESSHLPTVICAHTKGRAWATVSFSYPSTFSTVSLGVGIFSSFFLFFLEAVKILSTTFIFKDGKCFFFFLDITGNRRKGGGKYFWHSDKQCCVKMLFPLLRIWSSESSWGRYAREKQGLFSVVVSSFLNLGQFSSTLN